MMTDTLLRNRAGKEEYDHGKELFLQGRVQEKKRSREECAYQVTDEEELFSVRMNAGAVRCSCEKKYCCHTVAAMLSALDSGAMQDMEKARAQLATASLFETVSGALPVYNGIQMMPVLFLTKEGMRIGLKIGEERLYVVRHIPHFLKSRDTMENVPFGKGFEYRPQWMRFEPKQERLLDILAELCEMPGAPTLIGAEARVMLLSGRACVRVLEALKDTPFMMQINSEQYALNGIQEKELPLSFHLAGTPQHLSLTAQLPDGLFPITRDFQFVMAEGECVTPPLEQRSLLSTLARYSSGQEAAFSFMPQETPRVMSELMPFLLRVGVVTIDPTLEKSFLHLPLQSSVYLDKDGTEVLAQVTFHYGDIAIDPFAPEQPKADTLLLRDAVGERAVLDELARDGFHICKDKIYLSGNERIYDFVAEGAGRLCELGEVFFSKDFRKLTPQRPQLRGFVRLLNGHLVFELDNYDQPIEDLIPLMEALRKHRQYFRFEDGTYLDLSDLNDWQPLAEAIIDAREASGEDQLSVCWAAYLQALIRENNLNITLDEESAQAASLVWEVPEAPISMLRPYQKRGYEWLMTLHALHMGGILADDMGLGKTVQTLSAILACVQRDEERLPSLIVTPTSLTYNWLNECERFAPELSVMLISGSQPARAERIQSLKEKNAPDIVITSYPLIRRDIALLADIPFRFAVLDEAQQIKNVQSVGAQAVKQLTAHTRIALTGTPMENHAGELWSLFDFVLPGYLPRYTDFLHRWGEGQNAEDLRNRIRPFLMRRLKNDVLEELPEKMERVLMADMPMEQRRVYDAAMLQKRARVNEILLERGLGRGRAEVLSAITELREICCHPALCLNDYKGQSGKLEMLMDVLPPALAAGHRALVFSQFTSMLHIIEKRFQEEGISYLYLDGETPASQRVDLTQRFNEGEASVFLISLKAGGTGLNLTGADLVIHYDPWWNPTAEEQATGRAHRIGQTKKVEVIRLVMHSSIEEQVLSMNERKRDLFERLITPGEELPTRMNEKDILALFDGMSAS